MNVAEATELLREHFGDEPIFILRAKDRLFVPMLRQYAAQHENGRVLLQGPDDAYDARVPNDVRRIAREAMTWQYEHPELLKLADMPGDTMTEEYVIEGND